MKIHVITCLCATLAFVALLDFSLATGVPSPVLYEVNIGAVVGVNDQASFELGVDNNLFAKLTVDASVSLRTKTVTKVSTAGNRADIEATISKGIRDNANQLSVNSKPGSVNLLVVAIDIQLSSNAIINVQQAIDYATTIGVSVTTVGYGDNYQLSYFSGLNVNTARPKITKTQLEFQAYLSNLIQVLVNLGIRV